MSWRIGLGNLLHHMEAVVKGTTIITTLPTPVASVVRRSIAETSERNLFIDGPRSPVIAVVSKCMKTNHLKPRVEICFRLLKYVYDRPKYFQMAPIEAHFYRLFQKANEKERDEEGGDCAMDHVKDLIDRHRKNDSDKVNREALLEGEAKYVIKHDWAKALCAYLRAHCPGSARAPSDSHLTLNQCASLPLRLLQLWTMENPRSRWRFSLRIIESTNKKYRTPQHTTAERLLRALGPLAWEVWNVHAGTFPKHFRTDPVSFKADSFAITALPRWEDRWLAAFRAFEIITSTKQSGKLNYDLMDLSQVLWTKLGHFPQTPHLYIHAVHRRLVQHVDSTRLAGALRCFAPLEKVVALFADVQCSPETISWILLQLLSIYHLRKDRLVFTTILATDSILDCMQPQLKASGWRDSTFYLILKNHGFLMDGEPIYFSSTRLFSGQRLTVDFRVLWNRGRAYLSSDATNSSRCFFEPTRVVAFESRHSVALRRGSVFWNTTSFKKENETVDDGMRVIQFSENPLMFFQPLYSETTLVKSLMPYFARVDHPMAWNDQLFDEQRTFEFIGVDTHGEPSLHVYSVQVSSNTCASFDFSQQTLSIRRYCAANNLTVLGDTEIGGPHLCTPIYDKPLIALREQRFRHPLNGEKVIFETTTCVNKSQRKGICADQVQPMMLNIPS